MALGPLPGVRSRLIGRSTRSICPSNLKGKFRGSFCTTSTFPVTGARPTTHAEHGDHARVRVDWGVRLHNPFSISIETSKGYCSTNEGDQPDDQKLVPLLFRGIGLVPHDADRDVRLKEHQSAEAVDDDVGHAI
jgi:hypothetical protein